MTDKTEKLGCTVVSFVPFDIFEEKPGLIPGRFAIPACKDGKPQVLHVDKAIHYVYLDETRGSLVQRNPSDTVAESIVEDFVTSQMGISEGARPALFWVPGLRNEAEVSILYKERVEQALAEQKHWFLNCCRIADDDWNKYRKHNSVSDTQRQMAVQLGWKPEQHPWMDSAVIPESISVCPSCTTQVNSAAVLCPNCKCVLDVEKFKGLQFA